LTSHAEGALPMAPHESVEPPHRLHRFDPERMASRHERFRQELPPETMLRDLITEGETTLADIGCGPGFFTVAAARLLPQGRVLAIDVQADMLQAVRTAAAAAGLPNITTIEADAAALPDGSVDAVLTARSLVDTPAKDAIVAEAWRILRPGAVATSWNGTASRPPWDRRSTSGWDRRRWWRSQTVTASVRSGSGKDPPHSIGCRRSRKRRRAATPAPERTASIRPPAPGARFSATGAAASLPDPAVPAGSASPRGAAPLAHGRSAA
jgi:SAM-dependent methyltransferase